MDSVESRQIAAIGYDVATQTLAIQFKSKTGIGSVYHYDNVTADDFSASRDAESIGSWFYKNVKPYPEKYPYRKVDENKED